MIKIYRVSNGTGLTPDEEREKASESFQPHYVHLRYNSGEYFVIVLTPEVQGDYTLIDSSDPDYAEIKAWVDEEGFVERMFDTEITGSIH